MTRRLDPEDRITELGGASVPFRFDIHAMIYSEDAPTLENALHQMLEKRSVNRINARKEFFDVSLEEIEEIVRQQDVNAEFIRIPFAEEFRKTQANRSRSLFNGGSPEIALVTGLSQVRGGLVGKQWHN